MTLQVNETTLLQLVNDNHADELYRLAEANRKHLSAWLPWLNHMESVDFIKNFIAGSKKRYADKSEFAFVIVCNNAIVGRVGVYYIDQQNRIGSIGYWISEEYQGKGLITESCKEIINHSFAYLGLNRLEIKCGTNNLKSIQVPERLGFKKEGIIRQGELVNGEFIDLYLYSMLKSDWNG
jgi:ribosomal-protein-serine acetyltransferase